MSPAHQEIIVRFAVELLAWMNFFLRSNNWLNLIIAALFAFSLIQGDMAGTVTMNFGQLFNSFLAMYQICSSENWTTVLYNATDAELSLDQAIIVCTYLCCWLLFANFIVLQMFIAVINENFSVAEEAKRGMQATSHSEQHSRSTISRWTSLLYPYLWLRPKSTRVTAESPSSTSVLGEAEVFVQQSPLPTDHGPEFSQKIVYPSGGERIFGTPPSDAHMFFQFAIFLAVVGNVAAEVIATPLYRQVIFGLVLFLEFLIKIIADGFLFTPNAYVRSIWNILDFVIMVGVVVNVSFMLVFVGGLSRFIRALKALQALRFTTLIKKMRKTFEDLILVGFVRILDAAVLAFADPNTGLLERPKLVPFLAKLSGVFKVRIYPSQYSVSSILATCQDKSKKGNKTGEIHVRKLNKLLNNIDFGAIWKRRVMFIRIYHEATVMCYQGKGISFTDMLVLLAHHKLINDHEALRLKELEVREEMLKLVAGLVGLDKIRSQLWMISLRREFPQVRERAHAAAKRTNGLDRVYISD
ncbi:hypothetical protein V8E55_008560 [Tylopilus felleus]